MRIGILRADTVLPQYAPQFGQYPAMIEQVLRQAAASEDVFVTYDVEQGEYPSDVGDCDAYVITGSKKSVYDDEDWIRRLEAFVLLLHARRHKLIGICFGHQLIAQALGGRTEPAAVGWGVGIKRAQIVERLPFMQPPASELRLIVSHKDQVTELPKGATLIATSDYCPNAAFVVGEHILTVQGHPEFCKEYSQTLMDFREDILGPETYRAGVESLTMTPNEDVFAAWAMRFIAAPASLSEAGG